MLRGTCTLFLVVQVKAQGLPCRPVGLQLLSGASWRAPHGSWRLRCWVQASWQAVLSLRAPACSVIPGKLARKLCTLAGPRRVHKQRDMMASMHAHASRQRPGMAHADAGLVRGVCQPVSSGAFLLPGSGHVRAGR